MDSKRNITYEICPTGIVVLDKLKKDADIIAESLVPQLDNSTA